MGWIADLIKLAALTCVKIVAYIIIVKLVTESIDSMSEMLKNVSDAAASPKTQGAISLLAGGVWTYDAVIATASDILIIVSLLSGIAALLSYYTGRKRKLAKYAQEDLEHAARMQAIQEEIEQHRKASAAAQARIDLAMDIIAQGKAIGSERATAAAEALIKTDRDSEV